MLVHLALLAVLLSMGVRAGDPSALPVVFVENFAPRAPIRQPEPKAEKEPAQSARTEAAEQEAAEDSETPNESLADASTDDLSLEPELTTEPSTDVLAELEEPSLSFIEESETLAPPIPPTVALPQARKIEIPPEQRTKLLERITQAARELTDLAQTEITWEEDGREYRAVLRREAPSSSMDLERVAAEVRTTDQGTSMHTQLWLSRLAFSQFGQVIDRWDPNVQLHDDEIIGRFHSNTSLLIRASHEAIPKFFGKVTVAARDLRFDGSRRRQKEMFQGGLQTSAQRIDFPERAKPFVDVPKDSNAHVHRFADDAHIVFYGDGSYTFQGRRSDAALVQRYSPDEPVYLLGEKNVTLYVRGVVRGYVLVYSPYRIVIEGSLTYSVDPRVDSDSDDYLGLVSDRNVEIARPYVTGRGDLRVDGAIFARRRFLVTDIERPHRATLWIYGSLTAGTVSASEPRYATKVEFDPRFDRVRPPGFPSTNRFELASWDGSWTEASLDEL
ncbi:MAG TPA: hypothetical protein VIL28_06740 [Steroidobacteraceae bacterium]